MKQKQKKKIRKAENSQTFTHFFNDCPAQAAGEIADKQKNKTPETSHR